jgi:hypothetical protein
VKITLTNVRGFEGTHTISIRPITILIGENSSGKTTLLAAISAALSRDFPTTENLFNRAPFELGSFDTIATYRGGKYGRATSFSIGWEADVTGDHSASIAATFKSQAGTPRLDRLVVKDGQNELTARTVGEYFEFKFSFYGAKSRAVQQSAGSAVKVVEFKTKLEGIRTFRLQDTIRYYFESLDTKSPRKSGRDFDEQNVVTALHEISVGSTRFRPHVTALAPMRTRPRRTYDELSEDFKPEGDHIPLVLARLLASKDGKASSEFAALMRYGTASGLFEKIDVKRLGKQPSDPFQVRIKMKGPDANLIDVGYGVSQSLPIVIDSIMAARNEVLLVQQPEVHLHPKAQAALGTFFVELAVTSAKQFVIETHSDYLIDRVRMAVAEKKISAGKVQLLYLDRKGLDITVHELKLDDFGNITNAPSTYREFFLQEEIKLMGRAS